jgi:hypothetical protein
MVTIMDMNTGKVISEPDEYGDEVLNASWLPPRPEPSLQLEQVEHHAADKKAPPIAFDIEGFLRAVYRFQE